MPIDADAYMAGAIPALSRGGSWATPTTSSPSAPPTSPGGMGGGTVQPSIYSGMQQQALGGFFQNPLMLGRMAAFGSAAPSSPGTSTSPGTARPPFARKTSHESRVPESPHHQRRPMSVITSQDSQAGSHPGSPLRYGGWSGGSGGRMGPGSPDTEGSVRQRRGVSAREGEGGISPSAFGPRSAGLARRSKWDDGDWESNAGAPKQMYPEPSYGGSVRPRGPMSLPLAEVQREDEGRRNRSQPKMRRPERLSGLSGPTLGGEGISPSSARFRPSPLSGISHDIQEEELMSTPSSASRKTARFETRPVGNRRQTDLSQTPSTPGLLRPALHRRSTAEKLEPSPPPAPSLPGMTRRHTEQVETPPAPPPVPTPRVRVASSPHPTFNMRSMADALDSKRSHRFTSPYADEGYDRYVAHPAAPSPTAVDRSWGQHQQEVSITLGNGTKQNDYLPLGYARPTEKEEWNRDGPAMKTHGVPWMRDVAVLPPAPEGPRWVQARPPRAAEVQGGSWWESGGE